MPLAPKIKSGVKAMWQALTRRREKQLDDCLREVSQAVSDVAASKKELEEVMAATSPEDQFRAFAESARESRFSR